ncbi:barstar family protein [Gemmobacter serpentinus]|uniref:barstar family protein n=1 Tax=Gemmobacter serpentinus TaxID=2652247 RepID=UPI00124BEF84|nr:barstar family protein [Gemmobacter serpentinus]
MAVTLTLEGRKIPDIAGFYAELNRVFMADEDWQLGASLDALDDLLYGGYGVLRNAGPVTVIWQDSAISRTGLGRDATRAYYRAKLDQPGRFDVSRIAQDLAALERGEGPTYFEIVLQIFTGHPEITLVLA